MSEIKEANINDILTELRKRKKRANLKLVSKAYEFANSQHKGQLRKSGEPYIIHPLNVAYVLATIDLDESTIKANARFFESEADVPRKAITMGMASIMQAKKVLLIANGANKKKIVEKAFFGPITPEVPASILQLHPDLTVIYSEN